METKAIEKIVDETFRPAAPANRKPGEKVNAQPPETTTEPSTPETPETIKKVIDHIARQLESTKDLRMSFDSSLNRVIVTVVRGDTDEVIRQIPASDFISFAKQFDEYLGLIVNRRV